MSIHPQWRTSAGDHQRRARSLQDRSGQLTVEQIACSPKAILEDVSSLLKARAESKGVAFLLEYATPLPEWIKSDALRLRQILMNLCGTPSNSPSAAACGSLRKSCQDRLKQLQFDVVDSGVGIRPSSSNPVPAVLAGRCFCVTPLWRNRLGPFDQSQTRPHARRRSLAGGIGLSMWAAVSVDAQCRGHRVGAGRIGVAHDRGSSACCGHGITGRNDCPVAGVRILLAEDGPDNQRLISFILKKVGVVVTVVENGQQAFEAALQAWETAIHLMSS